MSDKVKKEIFNSVNENVQALAKLFPSVVKDGEVDFDALKEELGEFIEVGAEKYDFTWAGKSKAKAEARDSGEGLTLKLKVGEGVNEDTTQNIYIEGDNLKALKLLRNSYYGAIKMIYIDPPYNTGSDFVYKDNFTLSQEELDELGNNLDEEGNRLEKNSGDSARYHTDWLNMLYPRLKIARDLLTEDGVIFISIDDNEYCNLKRVCDEVFGENCYTTTLHVEMSATQGMKVKAAQNGNIVKNAEYILVYSKDGHKDIACRPMYDFRPEYDEHYSKYLTSDYKLTSLKEVFHSEHPDIVLRNLSEMYAEEPVFRDFVLKHVNSICADDKITGLDLDDFDEGRVYKIHRNDKTYYIYNNGTKLRQLLILAESFGACDDFNKSYGLRKIRGDWWKDFYKDMGNVSKEGDMVYANGKKPVRLIKQLCSMVTTNDDIVLDFFGGSCTTAHAVMQLNAEDGMNRKFVMVQLPELIDYSDKDNVKNYQHLGLKTVCDIGEERIRRAGKKILEDLKTCGKERKREGYTLLASGYGGSYEYATWNNKETGLIEYESKDMQNPTDTYKYYPNSLDIGFKVFEVAETNIRMFSEEMKGNDLFDLVKETDKELRDFMPETKDIDVCYELLLRHRGVALSSSIEKLDIGERTYIIADSIVVCLDSEVTEEMVEKLAVIDPQPMKYIFRDSAFGDDISLKENTMIMLSALIEKTTGDSKKAYKVEFI